MPHRWTESDDIAALYLFKFGKERGAPDVDEEGARRGLGGASLRMRIGNFAALATGSGLNHVARQTARVFEKYGSLTEPALREILEQDKDSDEDE